MSPAAPNVHILNQQAATLNAQVFSLNADVVAKVPLRIIQNMTITNGFAPDPTPFAYTQEVGAFRHAQNYWFNLVGGPSLPNKSVVDSAAGTFPFSVVTVKPAPANYQQITTGDSPSATLKQLQSVGFRLLPVTYVGWRFVFDDYLIWTMPESAIQPNQQIIYTLAIQRWWVGLYAINNGGSGGWANTIINPNKSSGVFAPFDFTPSASDPVIKRPNAADATKIR